LGYKLVCFTQNAILVRDDLAARLGTLNESTNETLTKALQDAILVGDDLAACRAFTKK
jgi:hypothetical protein